MGQNVSILKIKQVSLGEIIETLHFIVLISMSVLYSSASKAVLRASLSTCNYSVLPNFLFPMIYIA